MSDEWRVSLVLGDLTGVPRKLVEDLRVRLGDDIAVSADRGARIFLYAGTDKAAEEAEQVAREVLTLEGQVAESSLLECWDPDRQKWRDPRVEAPADEDDQKMGRLRSTTGAVINGVVQVFTDGQPY